MSEISPCLSNYGCIDGGNTKKCVKLRKGIGKFYRGKKRKEAGFKEHCMNKDRDYGCCLKNPSKLFFKEVKRKGMPTRTRSSGSIRSKSGSENSETLSDQSGKYKGCGWTDGPISPVFEECQDEKYPVCAKRRRSFSKKKKSSDGLDAKKYNKNCLPNGRKKRTTGCCISKKHNRLTWKKIPREGKYRTRAIDRDINYFLKGIREGVY